MTSDEFDNLIDDATHAVNNIIPDAIISRLSASAHSDLLVRINDALSPVLRDLVGETED